jgi:hypothetical protein
VGDLLVIPGCLRITYLDSPASICPPLPGRGKRVLIPSHWMRKFAARILALASGKERVCGA